MEYIYTYIYDGLVWVFFKYDMITIFWFSFLASPDNERSKILINESILLTSYL